VPRDAEAWLAERGVAREPIRVTPVATAPDDGGPAPQSVGGAAVAGDGGGEHGPPPSAREAAQLARANAEAAAERAAAQANTRPVGGPTLEDDVAEALQFLRSSTATAPQSVGRLRRKLADRGTRDVVIDRAIERAHTERLVDDDAMVVALVEERRRKGHAPARLRTDLLKRGFAPDTVDRALAPVEAEDQEAAAFAVAKDKADRLTGVDAQTALRRVVGHVARRGYPEGLARKVAREAVDVTRDAERAAGR
jgi:regulatory protein